MNKSNTDKEHELAQKRVATNTIRIAHALNLLDAAKQELKWACEDADWNDEITYEMGSAMEILGCVLASLVRWNDPKQDCDEI